MAIKLQYGGDGSDFVAEQLLEKLKPESLKGKNLNELFKNDTKLQNTAKRYYKYAIVFQGQKQTDDAFITLLNYDFVDKNFGFTVDDIFAVATTIQEQKVNTLTGLSYFLSKSTFKSKSIKSMKTKFGIDTSYLGPLVEMLINNKFYVSTALLADQTLDAYLSQVHSNMNVEFAVKEVRKMAKHILKALVSLHADGIVHRDLQGGNITRTLVRPDGKPEKVKCQLIDFGASITTDKNNRTENIKHDLESLGYGVLIPAFYQLVKKQTLSAGNAKNYDKINEIAAMNGVDPQFVDFLKKLKNGFKSADDALKHNFITKGNK